MSEEIKDILNKFDKVLENYELDKKFKQFSVDSICHLFPYEMLTIKNTITYLQQRVEQLENENEYLKMSNPEQNMEHFRIVNENKRKIDMLRKENHQLENIRKEQEKELESWKKKYGEI